MKKIFKLLIVALALTSALTIFCACKREGADSESGDTDGANAPSGTAVIDGVVLAENSKTEYTVVYNSVAHKINVGTEYEVKISVNNTDRFIASDFARALKRFTGAKTQLVKDSSAGGELEIIIGNADREGVRSEVGADEYGYEMLGQKLYIFGGSQEAKYYAANHFIQNYMVNTEDGRLVVDKELSHSGTLPVSFAASNWQLLAPAYEGGELQKSVYDAGSGLSDDSGKTGTVEDSFMQVVGNTTAEEYSAYVSKLERAGYIKSFEKSIEKNKYTCFNFGGSIVYTYYIDNTKTVRIIEDRSSNATASDLTDKHEGKGDVEMFQYSLDYTANGYTGTDAINCGMFYIIKLPDNSLILIDGGHTRQVTDEALNGMIDFLHGITATEDTEPLRVAAWHFTHADGDHTAMFSALTKKLGGSKGIEVDCFIFNFPSAMLIGQNKTCTEMKTSIARYYPNAKYIKEFTGMTFDFGEVQLEAMYTNEAAYDAAGGLNAGDANDVSTNMFIYFGGCKTWCMADVNQLGEKNICNMYSNAYLKSDVVLASHHGKNATSKLYSAASAGICFVSMANAQEGGYPYYSQMTNKIYYAGEKTFSFKAENGTPSVYQYERAYPPRYK